jgi:hypothetical protein
VGCLAQQRVVGQAKVVVGAQVDDLATIIQADYGLLTRGNDTFALVQSLRAKFGALCGKSIEK